MPGVFALERHIRKNKEESAETESGKTEKSGKSAGKFLKIKFLDFILSITFFLLQITANGFLKWIWHQI